MTETLRYLCLSSVFLYVVITTQAQLVDQTIELQPGWNAVYLEVQPSQNESSIVFEGMPVESVWYWNRQFSTIQYVQDINELIPEQPDWLTYFPPDSEMAFATDLFRIDGGKPYLIKLIGNEPYNWTIVGKPMAPKLEWLGDSFNYVGISVVEDAPPSFQGFFQPSVAHRGQQVLRLNLDGDWVQTNLNSQMKAGEAFWVYCQGESHYQGPLDVMVQQGSEIDFGSAITEYTVEIHNPSTNSKTITLKQEDSLSSGQYLFNSYAGAVPLSYYEMDLGNRIREWIEFTQPLNITLLPGETEIIQFAVRRPDLLPPLDASPDATYQSILTISDQIGCQIQYPVVVQSQSNGHLISTSEIGESIKIQSGLWVGTASIQAVNQPSDNANPSIPVATDSEFQLRLIIHVDHNGTARLLQQVYLLWQDGIRGPSPNNPGNTILLEPGRMVLLTDESLIQQYSGSTLRNGKQIGKRISSSAFSFRDPIEMTFTSGSLGCEIVLDYNDPLNPFKHRYHPDHNNLTERFNAQLPEGIESYTVIRELGFDFTAEDPEQLPLSGWGDTHIGGIYRETIMGIHKDQLVVEGVFRLTRAVDVDVLNDASI